MPGNFCWLCIALDGQLNPHGINDGLVIRLAEDGAAGHKGIGTGRCHSSDIFKLDAATATYVRSTGIESKRKGGREIRKQLEYWQVA